MLRPPDAEDWLGFRATGDRPGVQALRMLDSWSRLLRASRFFGDRAIDRFSGMAGCSKFMSLRAENCAGSCGATASCLQSWDLERQRLAKAAFGEAVRFLSCFMESRSTGESGLAARLNLSSAGERRLAPASAPVTFFD